MANSGTLHGRNSRIYIGVGAAAASPIPKINNATGTAVSKWEINLGLDYEEDTAQGDTNKTYVPGLADFQGSLDFFWQDYNTAAGAQQFTMVDAANNGTVCRFYGYHGIGAGVTAAYFSGLVYLSLKSLPADVKGLVMASFDMRAAGPIVFTHP